MADDQANLHGCVDGSGSVVVTGQSYRDANTTDFATLAYSSTGVPLWANRYNGPSNGDDIPLTKRSLALGPGGSVYVAVASDVDYSSARSFDFVTVKYLMPRPSLSVTRSKASVILLWPASALNSQFQSNTNIPVSNGWCLAADTRAANNRDISVAIPAMKSGRFFRLESQ